MNYERFEIVHILFRADSSSNIGLGHIMRDLVLAKQYKNDTIYFACQNLDGNIIDKIPYETKILHSNNIDELIKLIDLLHIDLLVIDHYGITYNDEKRIKEKTGVKILSFDDTYEKHYCDILLNHNISADEKRYKELVPESCELRCGSKYTLIRDEFKDEKKIKREKIYDIFLAMGGTDSANINIPILNAIPDSLKVSLLTTSSNAHLGKIKEYIKHHRQITLHVDSNEVAKLMNQSKYAIITPSVIVHEVLFMQLPFLAIKVAENQDDIYKYLKKKNFLTIEKFEDNKLKTNIKKLMEKEA